jgi:hypothetical protein
LAQRPVILSRFLWFPSILPASAGVALYNKPQPVLHHHITLISHPPSLATTEITYISEQKGIISFVSKHVSRVNFIILDYLNCSLEKSTAIQKTEMFFDEDAS